MTKARVMMAAAVAALCHASGAALAAEQAPVTGERPFAPAPFTTQEVTTFVEPWAMTFLPDGRFLVTERKGVLRVGTVAGQKSGPIAGVPKVDYGGQGGLGDIALAPDFAKSGMVYLSWAEAGEGDTRGAALGRAKLVLGPGVTGGRLEGLQVIWRQSPKVAGRGHFSHRIAFSPDGKYLFLTSGERQKFTPAQDMKVNLGKVLRLNLDGTPAKGNPFESEGGVTAQIWSLGHRNLLGIKFDPQGRLWELEHGPAGGDELNLIVKGRNYGWPVVSNGDNYDGSPIPRHPTHPEFEAPKVSWNPVIAPGDFIFYAGRQFPAWNGNILIAGMKSTAIVRVEISGDSAREAERYEMDSRVRELKQAPDGTLYALEDGPMARLLKIVPKAGGSAASGR